MTRNAPERGQRRRGLTDKMLATMKRRTKRYIVSDPDMRGHYVRVPPQGPIVFAAVARDPDSEQVWAKIGTTAELTIGQARERRGPSPSNQCALFLGEGGEQGSWPASGSRRGYRRRLSLNIVEMGAFG